MFSYKSELEEQAQLDAIGWLTGSKWVLRVLTSTSPQLQLPLLSSASAFARQYPHSYSTMPNTPWSIPCLLHNTAALGDRAGDSWRQGCPHCLGLIQDLKAAGQDRRQSQRQDQQHCSSEQRQDHKQGWSTGWESSQLLRHATPLRHSGSPGLSSMELMERAGWMETFAMLGIKLWMEYRNKRSI